MLLDDCLPVTLMEEKMERTIHNFSVAGDVRYSGVGETTESGISNSDVALAILKDVERAGLPGDKDA